MRHIFVVLLLNCLVYPTLVMADSKQQQWVIDNQIQSQSLSALVVDIVRNNQVLLAVGERGHIFKYNNKQWRQINSPVSSLLTKVFFLDSQKVWAVGHDATILYSDNAGDTWSVQMHDPEIEKPLFDIYFFDENEGLAVGAYGLVYRTFDGGKSWQQEFHHELLLAEDREYLEEVKQYDEANYLIERSFLLPHFNRIFLSSQNQLIVIGEGGFIAVSGNKGLSFTLVDFPYHGSLFGGVEFNNQIYVVGLRGHMFRTDHKFLKWQSIPLNITSSINNVYVNGENIYMVGNSGTILTMNKQQNIKTLTPKQGEHILALSQDKEGKFWYVGTSGIKVLTE